MAIEKDDRRLSKTEQSDDNRPLPSADPDQADSMNVEGPVTVNTAESLDSLRLAADSEPAIQSPGPVDHAEVEPGFSGDDQLLALLCYWTQVVMPFVLPVIVLLSESGKRRPFQRYHAIQSLSIMGAIMASAVAIIAGIGLTFQMFPPLGALFLVISFCLVPIAYPMVAIALIIYGWHAYKGKRFTIPVLTSILRHQGWLD